MNILDIMILITLIPTVLVGIKKGFISQAISVLTILIGFWASSIFADSVSGWLANHITADQQTLKIASFVIIFTVVFVVLLIVGKILEKNIAVGVMAWVNKGLGAVLAVVNYALIVGVCLKVFEYVNIVYNILPDTTIFENSALCKTMVGIADGIFPYIAKLFTTLIAA